LKKNSLSNNFKVLLPFGCFEILFAPQGIFPGKKYSQKISLKGLLGIVDFELPWKWSRRYL